MNNIKPSQVNIAVFIDFENFGRLEMFDARMLMDKLKERGRLIVKKAYADWGRFSKYKRQMLENSIELTELPSHCKRGKNSADIKLVVDALETAIIKDYIDTIVVVSGDSDYTPLISKLREYNKYVIVIGDRKNISDLLKGYCDELIYYSSLVEEEAVEEADMSVAYNLLVRAIIYLENQGIETRSSQVKSYMRQLDSSFNESNYGFSQFKSFLIKAQKEKIVRLQEIQNSGDFLIKNANNHNNHHFEKTSFHIISETSKRLLAQIRKRNFQFLGPELQEIVLRTLYDVLVTNENPITTSEIIESAVDRLKSYIDNGKLSKTKISQIWQILYRSHCLEISKDSEESPLKFMLKNEFSQYESLRRQHDFRLILISLMSDIRLTHEEWAEFLYASKNGTREMQKLMDDVSAYYSSTLLENEEQMKNQIGDMPETVGYQVLQKTME